MKWNEMTSMQKIGFLLVCFGGVLMVASFVKPDLFPINMITPGVVITTVGEAMDYWQKSRKWAYLFIGAAVIAMACFVLELCLL